jgi:hypothetical protein
MCVCMCDVCILGRESCEKSLYENDAIGHGIDIMLDYGYRAMRDDRDQNEREKITTK